MADDPDIVKPSSSITPAKDFLPGFPTLTDFANEGLKRVAEASRAFQSLPPAGPLWDLQKSFPEFRRAMKNCRTRIEPLMKILLEHEKISTHGYGKRAVEEKLDFLVEANDDILERVGTALDDADGLFKRAEIVVVNKSSAVNSLKPPGTWGKKKIGSSTTGGDFRDTSAHLTKKFPIIPVTIEERPIKKAFHRIRVTEKPQLKFFDTIDNSLGPFVPKLKFKSNSIKPLSLLPEYTSTNEEFYGHPYEVELNRWEAEGWMMEKLSPIPPKSLEETPFTFVTTPSELEAMITELHGVYEIAVDLEHHSYRTFLGLTCLMQISTREKDYVIDTLVLWRDLEPLNDIFTNPKIIKIFHGASSDLEWLQRDFGIYVVGLFDTYLAMKQLKFEQFSLQHLLAHFCAIEVDKKYQLADWRLRPLPEEMFIYARQDTHFLLFIYDLLRDQLLVKGNQFSNLLRAVYEQSKIICLKRYEKPGRNPQLALRKSRRNLNNRQLYAFTELYNWRDRIGREKDESLGFVLPNHMLLTIADTLPKEMTGILSCCEPVPLLVHQHLADLHRIVLKARDLALHEDKVEHSGPEKRKKQKEWMVLLNSIHDINLQSEKDEIKEEVSTWPQPWTPPEGWEEIIVRKSSRILFGRGNGVGNANLKTTEKSNAYERFELSNNILDILRNPKKKENLDMNDPLVRVVTETLLSDALDEDKPVSAGVEKQGIKIESRTGGLHRVLPEKDFVAFNPMGYGRKWRVGKMSTTHVEPPQEMPVVDLAEAMNEVAEEDEMTESKTYVPIAKSKKGKKQKFFDKMKWMKKKGKRQKSEDNSHKTPPQKSKKLPEVTQGQQKNVAGARGQQKSMRGNGGRFFTNPFRSKEGKTITFKK